THAQTDIVSEFKYGSIGTEGTVGVPYWVFRVLPEVFADKLPNRPGTGYARFLSAVAKDPRFTADTLIAAMKKHPEFGFFDGIVYRLLVIGRTKAGILERDPNIAWFDKRPPQG